MSKRILSLHSDPYRGYGSGSTMLDTVMQMGRLLEGGHINEVGKMLGVRERKTPRIVYTTEEILATLLRVKQGEIIVDANLENELLESDLIKRVNGNLELTGKGRKRIKYL